MGLTINPGESHVGPTDNPMDSDNFGDPNMGLNENPGDSDGSLTRILSILTKV